MELTQCGCFLSRKRFEELDSRGHNHGCIPPLCKLTQIAPVFAFEFDPMMMRSNNFIGQLAVERQSATVNID